MQIEVQARIKSSERNEATDDSISDQTIAEELLIGWSGVLDEDGDEVPFSESMKQQLLDIPTMATAIIVAYFDSLTGTKTKNF